MTVKYFLLYGIEVLSQRSRPFWCVVLTWVNSEHVYGSFSYEVNHYIVRSYRDVIIVTNTATKITNKV